MHAGSILLEEMLISFNCIDFQLKTIDLNLQTLYGSKRLMSNISGKQLIAHTGSYRAVIYRFVSKKEKSGPSSGPEIQSVLFSAPLHLETLHCLQNSSTPT